MIAELVIFIALRSSYKNGWLQVTLHQCSPLTHLLFLHVCLLVSQLVLSRSHTVYKISRLVSELQSKQLCLYRAVGYAISHRFDEAVDQVKLKLFVATSNL